MDPRRRNLIVIVVVVIFVVAGVGTYYVLRHSPAVSSCGPNETGVICVDQAEIPDSLDPAVTFSTPGWAAVQQVYQGLVNYNGSSSTDFSGVLAKNWSVVYDPTTNFSSYVFDLRSNVTFSNGDPYNAYVQWYSLYRSLLLIQGPQFILAQNFWSTNFNTTSPLSYYSVNTTSATANTTLANDLNSWNFDSPTASEIAQMSIPDQSFQVINEYSIALNLGYGYLFSNYTYLLASISAPNSYAVDPAWVDGHGGVQVGTVNTYLATDAMGTGPYLLQNYNGVGGGGYTLTPRSPYWGAPAFKTEPWNINLASANTTVDVIFQDAIDITTNDLLTGAVQEASFAYVGPSTIQQLQGHTNVEVKNLSTVYGATSGSWWIYLNSSIAPFNNLSVREAISHAIDYQQIITQAFGGYATQWVGPVPPAYPYNNNVTAKDPYYSYNLALAKAEIADSPCAGNACSGNTIKYEYLNTGNDWVETAQFLEQDLNAIGISIDPVGISLSQLYEEQARDTNGACVSSTSANGGPFSMGQEFYTSDYISPDDWTQNDFVASGSANECMAGFNSVASSSYSSAINNLTYLAASDSNPADLTTYYTNMTNLMYNNYTDIWLVVPTSFAVYASDVHGFVQNPMASGEPYAIGFNMQWLS